MRVLARTQQAPRTRLFSVSEATVHLANLLEGGQRAQKSRSYLALAANYLALGAIEGPRHETGPGLYLSLAVPFSKQNDLRDPRSVLAYRWYQTRLKRDSDRRYCRQRERLSCF